MPHAAQQRCPPSALRLAIVVATAVAVALPSTARAHDGAIKWLTLSSDHIEVVFPSRLAPLARRVLSTAEDAWRHLAPIFGYRPGGRLLLTIDDYSDSANGYATVLPFDRVHLQAYPPATLDDLGDHGDWIRMLVFHEIAHVLQMADSGELPALVNKMLGRTWLPGVYLPRFFLEGLSVYVESRIAGSDHAVAGQAGRLDSAAFMARLRAAARDGSLPGLDELTGRPLTWPRGGGWYLYGGLLIDHIARSRGHGRLVDFIGAYGRRFVPYGINILARQTMGRSLVGLWREATSGLRRRVSMEDRLRAVGVVPPVGVQPSDLASIGLAKGASATTAHEGRRLTRDGQGRGRLRFSADGTALFVARQPGDDLARIERTEVASGSTTVVHRCLLGCDDLTVGPRGEILVFAAGRPSRINYFHQDLFALTWKDGAWRGPLRLGESMRAREPSIDPTGRWLVYVAVVDGQTEVRVLELSRALEAARGGGKFGPSYLLLKAAPLGQTWGSPVLDGAGTLWVTRSAGSGRQLLRAAVSDDLRRPVVARPFQPTVARDACATLDWSGDSAVLRPATVTWMGDLQALRRDGQPLLGAAIQLGNFRDAAILDPANPAAGWTLRSWSGRGVRSAAFTADGERTAVTVHYGGGLEIHLPPAAPLPKCAGYRGDDAQATGPRAGRGAVGDAADAYDPPPVVGKDDAYSPWASVRPRAWLPIAVATSDPGAPVFGARTSGHDAVDWLRWDLLGQARLDGELPLLSGSLDLLRWGPSWSLSAAWQHGSVLARRGVQVAVRTHGGWRRAGRRRAANAGRTPELACACALATARHSYARDPVAMGGGTRISRTERAAATGPVDRT